MKICRVLLNNEAVTVVDYDGTKVQIPAIHRDAKTVKVILKNGRYTVVDDNYKEPELVAIAKKSEKKIDKKTTEKDVINDENVNKENPTEDNE